jgi:hypothetical protein
MTFPQVPGRALGIVIHEEDGRVLEYTRGEDASGEAVWVSSDATSITTAELLDALTTSLQAPHVAPDDTRID